MDDDAQRMAARELRLSGWSCRQIAEALGLTQRQAERLVADLPVPEWTSRPNAKDDQRARARELRAAGRSYTEIAAELGVSKSSCSLWLRDMAQPSPEQRRAARERAEAGRRAWWEKERAHRRVERVNQTFAAGSEIGRLTDRELLIAGTVLYWGGGLQEQAVAAS